MDNVLLPTEIEFYIETMVPQDIRHVGNKQWLEWHQRLQKLNQQALIEASQMREEHVKETLITFQKTPVLVHEAVLINIWKHKVLPQMLKLDPNPQNTFMGYTILYHEAVCVALLELVMYHGNCCDSLGDFSGDLLDYACGTTSQLLAIAKEPSHELLKQLEDLKFDIGIRCLSIIRYMAENLDRLPLSTTSRMYTTCDIPILFAQILTTRPWIRDGKQYSAGRWMDWDGEALGQAEAQVWLTLRQLLLDPACREYYTVTEARRAQLAKLMMLLTPVLMDQLAPLVELKQWLSHVTMGEQVAKGSRPVLLETVLEVKERIVAQAGGKWKKLAKEQLPVVFCNDQKTLMECAQTLSDAYNTDLIEKFEVKEKASCQQCGKSAIQRH
ncbi:Zinc finger MYND domain-containing protein 10 homolog-like Protein [Tribolium castaneum]|uniref:Zinc finger MYND domain-containing protein 10 homolog-like Protein n=1 Tax=Tribolium castaneum TaxID=7070 RepID=D6WSE0_TRICA|nr:Zinc finger MYND domain-containing protein 10 homolog-like Protein [Tribolium castaneum]